MTNEEKDRQLGRLRGLFKEAVGKYADGDSIDLERAGLGYKNQSTNTMFLGFNLGIMIAADKLDQ